MEGLENDIIKQTETQSDLSDWVGAPVDYSDVQFVEGIREGDDKVVVDRLVNFDRLFDMIKLETGSAYVDYGPASHPMIQICLDKCLQSEIMFQRMFSLYDGFAYDEVEFRISLSNPKGIVGGLIVGVYPFLNWYGGTFSQLKTWDDQNLMTRQRLMLSPDSHLMSYSNAKDLVITVPWQRNLPFMNCNYFNNLTLGKDNMPMPGCPILYVVSLAADYVSSVSMPARLRVYFRFKNPRWLSPIASSEDFVAQSGHDLCENVLQRILADDCSNYQAQSGAAIAGAIAAGAVAVDAAVNIGAEILSGKISAHLSTFDEGSYKEGTYEAPSSVQMAYVGDSTNIGPPPTTPIFRNLMNSRDTKHKLLDMLGEPQYLDVYVANNSSHSLYANPTAPLGSGNLDGQTQLCSYLRYFSQCAQFWRGTINFHFVIMGHPMVEVSYYLKITYPTNQGDTTDNMGVNTQMKGIVSGVHHIKVPMPCQNLRDHLPIVDVRSTTTARIEDLSQSTLHASFDVVSTMLDLTPTISIAVFYSAGEDFEFLQPQSVGLLQTVDVGNFVAQCRLDPPTETFDTRARSQNSLNMMVPTHYVEDFMEIWSRALPYDSYDENDEPEVRLTVATQPYWFPMTGGSASHTLNVNNSWWVTNDYLSFLSAPFLYYQGSIGLKILCDNTGTGTYRFVTLVADPSLRQPTNNPFTYSSSNLPPYANFGNGTVITPFESQPVMDLTIPFRNVLHWGVCNPQVWSTVSQGLSYPIARPGLYTNVVLHTPGSDLKDALFRKKGADYRVAVRGLLPPATLWVAKGYDWSDGLITTKRSEGEKTTTTKSGVCTKA